MNHTGADGSLHRGPGGIIFCEFCEWYDDLQEEKYKPMRGDDVELFIKSWRDEFDLCKFLPGSHGYESYHTLDSMLEDYRLHADTGTDLNKDVLGPGEDNDFTGR